MALHPDFPESPHAILDPGIRWFPTKLLESAVLNCCSPAFWKIAMMHRTDELEGLS